MLRSLSAFKSLEIKSRQFFITVSALHTFISQSKGTFICYFLFSGKLILATTKMNEWKLKVEADV